MKTRVSTTTLVTIFAAALLSSGCSNTRVVQPDQPPESVAPQAARMSDSVIRSDRDYLASVQNRLKLINSDGTVVDSYHWCKAQAWLDFATNEYNDNDRTGVVEAALAESLAILEKLEAGNTEISTATPVIATSQKMRNDLWAFADVQKTQGLEQCGSCDLAKMEVQLVWIGHEHNELGWRHALPAVAAAERLQRTAIGSSGTCSTAGPTVAKAVVPEQPAGQHVLLPQPVVVVTNMSDDEQHIIVADVSMPRYVHFGLRLSDLSSESRDVIRSIASVLKANTDIDIRLVGHTDVRGMSDYNQNLASNRANAVMQALIGQGVSADRLSTNIAGPYNPRALGASDKSHAQNRRVEIVIASKRPVDLIPQEQDLQLEPAD